MVVKKLGTIIAGSLADGLIMRVHESTPFETIKTGKFISIIGESHRFFSLITDLKLEVTDQDILLYPPDTSNTLLQSILYNHNIYATAVIRPMLMLGMDNRPCPVKTIPSHFAPVVEADETDLKIIFGDESHPEKKYFHIGYPLDMNTPVCIDLERLGERSNGIFGKTGTGKTFLTRLVLAGMIKNKKAVNLIFDMHSEYGLQARKEGSQHFVKGLKTLFPDQVVIMSLDPKSTRRRGGNPDVEIVFSYESIQVEDILSLSSELQLHPTALEAAYLISNKYKRYWLKELLSRGNELKEFAQNVGAHPESISALYRKIKRIEHLPFFSPEPQKHSVIDEIMEYLSRGINVIIEFGNFTSSFVYLLVANIITRKIHSEYIEKTEYFLASHDQSHEPKKLMITIEEAHKFLNSQASKQTIFGTIAREMRKYYVSLLVVDQRPSGIDPEILSQIGTKIIAQLNDDTDIQAALTGSSNLSTLKSLLATLDSKKQALMLGHALAMPVVIQTREYDTTFYAAMADSVLSEPIDTLVEELF